MKRSRKQRTDAAIAHALDRRWELAAEDNRQLLDDYPDDVEAANRLGKALTELGDFDGAGDAYRRTLEIDQTNAIARRNLSRLEELKAQAPPKKRGAKRTASSATTAQAVRPHALIEESGRSAEFTIGVSSSQALRRVSAGDPAELITTARGVSVRTGTGANLGQIEPKAGLRLRRLIEGGNRYAAVIRRVSDGEVAIYIRETFRDPSLADQPSFLPPATAARRRLAPRAYTKSSIVRYQAGPVDLGEEGEEGDTEAWGQRPARPESEEELGEAGFTDDSAAADDDDDDEMDGLILDEDEPIVADDEEDSE